MSDEQLEVIETPEEEVEEEDRVDQLRDSIPEREYRFAGGEIEVRRTKKGMGIAGSIPFDSESVEMMGFTEIIRPKAFDKTVRDGKNDIVSSWNHDPNWVLGRRSNDMLKLSINDSGLEYDVALDEDDAMHRHFARRVERRDVVGSSFTFSTVKDRWTHDDANEEITRELLEVKLYEIGPVTFPAYPKSDAQKRALLDAATVTCDGVDLNELAAILCACRMGPLDDEKQIAVVAEWLERLAGILPDRRLAPSADFKLRQRETRRRMARYGLM